MTTVREVSAFAPATVSNVGPGFDVLGFALDHPGDIVAAARAEAPGVVISKIEGDENRLPRDPDRNTASLAVRALLRARAPDAGVTLRVLKGMPLASGIGSSGASAAAAVVATNELLGLRLPLEALLPFAMEGERAAAGSAHPDNVAPALLGGFVLVRPSDPPDVVRLPVPAGLACVVLHPAIEVETRVARALLRPEVPLRDAVRQWANVGGLIAALYESDLGLLGRSLEDVIVEQQRAPLVPGFNEVKRAALESGALGCSFSGAGPSIFALCASKHDAQSVGDAMRSALRRFGRLEGEVFVSAVSPTGAHLVRHEMV
jgi:homoserine kinase